MDLYNESPDFYSIPIDTNTPDNPDFEIEGYLMKGSDDHVYFLHDRPFQKMLSWVEYDVSTSQLNFIMEDGDLRDFGIPVLPQFSEHLKVMEEIAVAEITGGKYKDGNNFPLIIHQ